MEENFADPKLKPRIIYTLDMAQKVRDVKAPVKGLIVDIKARPNYLALVIYESQVMQYDETRRGDIMDYLRLLRTLIMSYGTPCEIEGAKGAPKGVSHQ
jgi:hypothetical protein